MYQSFEARNFRCFRDFTIKDLARVNLIAGLNNAGKTALLEALFLHGGAYNPDLIRAVEGHRGVPTLTSETGGWAEGPWASLFHMLDTSTEIKLSGSFDGTTQRLLQLRVVRDQKELQEIARKDAPAFLLPQLLELEYREKQRTGKVFWFIQGGMPKLLRQGPSAPFPTIIIPARTRVPLDEDAKRFTELEGKGHLDVLLEALKLIEPRLEKVSLGFPAGGVPLRFGYVANGPPLPLLYMGEGMVRITSLILAIGAARGGVVLVDEIENGLHHSVLVDLWRAIAEAARKFDAQVFATTHSWECIFAAHRAFAGSPEYDFRLHRLDRVDDVVRAVTYDEDSIEGAIKARLEVR